MQMREWDIEAGMDGLWNPDMVYQDVVFLMSQYCDTIVSWALMDESTKRELECGYNHSEYF